MPESTKSPKDIAYEALKTAILTLDLSPGEDLDETRLCAEYGLSRTPLRDVFQRLTGEGYTTETLVMRSGSKTIRTVKTQHRAGR